MARSAISVGCCIAGGGPAGLMAGFLLARAGVDVLVLEKHADFLRDFRGDTIHPSTLEVMHELGLLEEFLKLPHEKVSALIGQFGDETFEFANFSKLPVHAPYIAMMPQWDFLNFLAEHAGKLPAFKLRMRTSATSLIEVGGTITGLEASGPDGPLEIRARLVIGADGRHSTVRAQAGLAVEEFGAPMDVLWFRISRVTSDPVESTGRFLPGRIFVRINRGDYWQCAYVIPKGAIASVRAAGLEAFRGNIARAAPFLANRTGEIKSWDDAKLLTVSVDRLRRWYRPGLLCIGDAVHAMSPIGGVGINLAVQDGVASANLLAGPLVAGRLATADLAAVQARREWPAHMTQRLQLFLQNRVIRPTLSEQSAVKPPGFLRVMTSIPLLCRIPGRLIGLGLRPEHVRV